MKTVSKIAIGGISILVAINMLLTTTTTAFPDPCYVGVAFIEPYWPWDDDWENCTEAQEDADAFLDWITSDSFWDQKFRYANASNHYYQWEISQDQSYVETAHFAYYAGHGYSGDYGWTKLVFNVSGLGIIYDSPRLYPDYCDWGDEGPLNWVALAACYVGNMTYKALDGLHLICATKCEIGEALYGDYFGEYLVQDNMTIKNAWFQTMDDVYDDNPDLVKGTVNVVGEDSSVGNDHIYYHGSVADDPTDDMYYTEWTHNPSS